MSLTQFCVTFAFIGSLSTICAESLPKKPVYNDNINMASQGNITKIGNSDFIDLARKYIGTVEEYDVITADNFILKIFRIPGNLNNVVISLHGFLCSSDDFLIRGNTSLIYMLSMKGYDIWAINFRGNRYSRRHKTMNPDSNPEFWQYSMHEMGYYDLPSVIDFVLTKTRQAQLSLVAYSEGNAATYIMMARRPEYNEKIKVVVSLAPAIRLSGVGKTLSTLIILSPIIVNMLTLFGIYEITGFYTIARTLINIICSQGILGYDLCVKIVIGSVTGQTVENLEPEFFYQALEHFPAGTSRRNLEHYAQIGLSGNFSEFNNESLNYAIYGAVDPLKYDLRNVKCRVALVASRNDLVAGVREIEQLSKDLPNVISSKIVSYDKFAHLDFLWGRNAYKVLYPHVISILEKYRLG